MDKKLKLPPPPSGARGGLPAQSIGGRFELIREIGKGTAATVYEGVQTSVDRPVAIKVLHDTHRSDSDYKARFGREAKAIARLNHPNCITLYDFGFSEELGSLYMVTEFVQGRELFDILREDEPDLVQTLHIAIKVGEALGHAHENGVLHRDLKPENVLVSAKGEVKVLDFGLSKIFDEIKSEHGRQLTAQGMAYGTPCYMSPEQCQSQEVDQRTDLYSLGIILFQMVEGHVPFDSADIMRVLVKQIQAPLPPITADIPDDLRDLIQSLLAKDRKNRPSDADEVVARMRALLIDAATKDGELPPDISQELSRSLVRQLSGGVADEVTEVDVSEASAPSEPNPVTSTPVTAHGGATSTLIGVGAISRDRPKTVDLVGQTINGLYRLDSVKATASLGTIFESELEGQPVVIRLLGHGGDHDHRFTEASRQQLEALQGVRHPNIANILDFGHDEQLDRDYVVAELIEGEPLRDVMGKRTYSISEALEIAFSVLEALNVAHDKGFGHEAIDPSTVLVAGDLANSKVVDFGLGSLRLAPFRELEALPYTAPEILLGKPSGPPADIYSVGALLWRLVAGRPPFVGTTPEALRDEILRSGPSSLASAARAVPTDIVDFVSSMMGERAERPSSAREAIERLDQIFTALAWPRTSSGALVKAIPAAKVPVLDEDAPKPEPPEAAPHVVAETSPPEQGIDLGAEFSDPEDWQVPSPSRPWLGPVLLVVVLAVIALALMLTR